MLDRYFMLHIRFDSILVMLMVFVICFLVAIACHFAIELPANNRIVKMITKNDR